MVDHQNSRPRVPYPATRHDDDEEAGVAAAAQEAGREPPSSPGANGPPARPSSPFAGGRPAREPARTRPPTGAPPSSPSRSPEHAGHLEGRQRLLLLLGLLGGQGLVLAVSFLSTPDPMQALSRSLMIIGLAGFALAAGLKLTGFLDPHRSTAKSPADGRSRRASREGGAHSGEDPS